MLFYRLLNPCETAAARRKHNELASIWTISKQAPGSARAASQLANEVRAWQAEHAAIENQIEDISIEIGTQASVEGSRSVDDIRKSIDGILESIESRSDLETSVNAIKQTFDLAKLDRNSWCNSRTVCSRSSMALPASASSMRSWATSKRSANPWPPPDRSDGNAGCNRGAA